MNRRKLLKVAGAAVASTAISAPAIAQSAPAVRWRLTTSFPKTLDTLRQLHDQTDPRLIGV
jgi:TRAP-type mannitol/chloroaromatic compound transport system substrate-binding protein